MSEIINSIFYENNTIFFILALIALLLLYFKNRTKKVNYKYIANSEEMPLEFKKIYTNLYKNNITELETLRKKTILKKYLPIIIFILSTFMLFLTKVNSIFLIISLSSIFFIIININIEKEYVTTYKTKLLKNFLKQLDTKFSYDPIGLSSINILENYEIANFDNQKFNKSSIDDVIQCKFEDNTYFSMCDLHLQKKIETKDSYAEDTIEIFQGLFSTTTFPKYIKTPIKIVKNKIKFLDRFSRVELDSSEFEKYFDIYSEDKNLTLRIFTADIMEYFLDFYNKYHIDFEVCIRAHTIYARFFTGPMFEPKLFNNSLDQQLLFSYYIVIKFVTDLSKKLKSTLDDIEI